MIRKGNNKFKTLHKGSELITRVFKGDELIYQDIDALYSFKFTVDTRLDSNGRTTSGNKVFAFRFMNIDLRDDRFTYDPVLIDWGDGTTETTTAPVGSSTQVSVSHTYDTAGEYQIKLLPTVFDSGVPRTGWLSGLDFNQVNSGNATAEYKVRSFDKILPEGSYNVCLRDQIRYYTVRACRAPIRFTNMRNLKSAPENLFENIAIIPHTGTTYFDIGTYWGFYCGYNVSATDFDFDPVVLLKKYLDKLDPDVIATVTNFGQMFDQAFCYTHLRSIPAGLFDNIKTSSATDAHRMFYRTFGYPKSTVNNLSIPSGLFDSIDTSKVTNASSMFCETFNGAFSQCTSLTIPDRLFPLDFSKVTGTNANELFSYTFYNIQNAEDVYIPEHIFDGLDVSNVSSLDKMFNGTFAGWSKCHAAIPADLFDNISLPSSNVSMYGTFLATFSGYSKTPGYDTGLSIPAGLFDHFANIVPTSTNSMFQGTFGDSSFGGSTVAVIPSGLFDFLDMSADTVVYQMFFNTFNGYGQASTQANVIPADLFDHIDITHSPSAERLFQGTFGTMSRNNPNATIPAGLFSNLDTSSTTSVKEMFSGTFSYFANESSVGTIPANLFSFLDLSNTTNCQGMFSGTFSNYAINNTTGQIPSGLFANITAPNCTNISSMFQGTFGNCFKMSTVASIPSGLFSALDTRNALSLYYTFYGTFQGYMRWSQAPSIPSDLFSSIDCTNMTGFYQAFRDTFNGCGLQSYPITIPATLFSTIDTSRATTLYQMFCSTFSGAAYANVPQGLLGGIVIPSGATKTDMFTDMFYGGSRDGTGQGGSFQNATLDDPFDGMSDFSWVSASDTGHIKRMFGTNVPHANSHRLTGSASTVLQHFNFTPTTDTNMFEYQTNLTDYSTIANNWK